MAKTTQPMTVYARRYTRSSAASLRSSCSASGRYILNTIAVPNPSSASDSIFSTLEYSPLTPKYTSLR